MKKILLILIVLASVQSTFSQGAFKITIGTTIKTSNSVHIVVANMNLINNGVVQQGNNGGTFTFKGENSTISGSGSINFNRLEVSKLNNSSVTLQTNVLVDSEVIFTNGLINLYKYVLDLGAHGVLIDESEKNRAFTTDVGYIQAIRNLVSPVAVNAGNLGAIISSAANLGNTIIRRGHAIQIGVYASNNSIQRFYDILPLNNTSLNATLRFKYFNAELNGIEKTCLSQWKSSNNITWDCLGYTNKDSLNKYVEKNGISDFAKITLSKATPPIITSLTAPIDPVALNTSINLNVTYTGSNVTQAAINWGDGTSVQIVANPASTFTTPHTYISAGVYTINVTLTDACDQTGSSVYQYVVIYDPNGGFVTGGGWINSPAGAYRPDVTLSGKSTFGFESKYQKGATVPSGNTEFKFHVAGMLFKSTIYDWLIISSSKAQYKGSGIINGGNYGFLLTAVDGNLKTPLTPDLFRIKIWDKNNADVIVYDNQYGSTDDAALSTQIAGGSIVIHNSNTIPSSPATVIPIAGSVKESGELFFKIKGSPNPSKTQFTLNVESDDLKEVISIRVIDVLGKVIEVRSNVFARQTLQIGNNYRSGIYFVEVIQGNNKKQLKLIKL